MIAISFNSSAGWVSKHVLPLFDYDTAFLALRGHIAAYLGVYLTQDAPALTKKPECYTKHEPTQKSWDELIKSTVYAGKEYEMHVYKVKIL